LKRREKARFAASEVMVLSPGRLQEAERAVGKRGEAGIFHGCTCLRGAAAGGDGLHASGAAPGTQGIFAPDGCWIESIALGRARKQRCHGLCEKLAAELQLAGTVAVGE
jgi:hypothetical protein